MSKLDNTNNSAEFLSKLGISLGDDDFLNEDEILHKKNVSEKTKEHIFRISLSQDDKLKLNLLNISPRELCETFIESFLQRDSVKTQIKNKLKQLK